MLLTEKPSFGFVLIFLVFSLIFLYNTYRLWFRTDSYYQEIYDSLTRQPTIYPFKNFFVKRMENKGSWVLWQKIFSAVGFIAVIGADVLVVLAYMAN